MSPMHPSLRITPVLILLVPVLASLTQGQSSRLQASGGVGGANLQPASRVDGGRLQPVRELKPAVLKTLAVDLVSDGLVLGKVKGALSSLPPSSLGELFYDVAQELERQEGGVTHTAIGYYMAALTDREGGQYQTAKRRLLQILLDPDLSHEQAVGLYDRGLKMFQELSASGVGISQAGVEKGLQDLAVIKRAYHARRKD